MAFVISMKPKPQSMKASTLLVTCLIAISTISCSDKPTLEELNQFAATETYPADTFLQTVKNKRALIIVAHDDDDCAMSGTISKLTSEGWEIVQLSLQSHFINVETKEHAANIICLGNEAILADRYYRRGLDTMKTAYLPIPLQEMEEQFLKEKLTKALIEKVNNFHPSVIFTLDNVKGGYGHPEHIFLSALVLELFQDGVLQGERIYQSVYTNHMETVIVDTWLKAKMEEWGYPHASTIANELYGIDGMPEPSVQIVISGQAQTKMAYLRAYPENVKRNLRKFIPYFEQFDAETYFSVFDREFFRVVKLDDE